MTCIVAIYVKKQLILHEKQEKLTKCLVVCRTFVNFASKICRMCLWRAWQSHHEAMRLSQNTLWRASKTQIRKPARKRKRLATKCWPDYVEPKITIHDQKLKLRSRTRFSQKNCRQQAEHENYADSASKMLTNLCVILWYPEANNGGPSGCWAINQTAKLRVNENKQNRKVKLQNKQNGQLLRAICWPAFA